MTRTWYKSVFLLFLFLLLTGSVTAAPSQNGWRIGCGTSVHARAGNLSDSPGLDYEMFVHYGDTSGAIWRIAVSRFEQHSDKNGQFGYVRMVHIWLLRGACIRYGKISILWLTGLGVGQYIEHSDDRAIRLGSLGFQSEVLIPLGLVGGWNMELGFSYSGSLIPATDRYIDRISLVGFVIAG